jgi:precorrin-4/cobalt-precorrin-4 C11-methyltransferase
VSGWAVQPGWVYFVGAGPGDPDLCTLRGKAVIESADLVLWADSLVHPGLLAWARPDARVVGTSALTLDQIVAAMVEAARAGGVVARLHSGDPSVYGAIGEQMRALDEAGVPYRVVPGVSSAFAAAAALRRELTAPGLAQTVVFTRVPRRTEAAPGERLREAVRAGGTLVLFLSLTAVEEAVAEMRAGGLDDATPAAVAHRVTWEDERLIRTTLGRLAADVREARLTRHGLILVGRALEPGGAARSRLYDRGFSHGYRGGRKGRRPPP